MGHTLASLSGTRPPNSAIVGYATEGILLNISVHLSTDRLRKQRGDEGCFAAGTEYVDGSHSKPRFQAHFLQTLQYTTEVALLNISVHLTVQAT